LDKARKLERQLKNSTQQRSEKLKELLRDESVSISSNGVYFSQLHAK